MRNFLKKFLSRFGNLQDENGLKSLTFLWNHPYLFHINRHSISKGVAIGLFVSLLPVPFQMLIAACMAFWLEANLPLAVLLTWLTNPLTFIPINFFIYHIGVRVLGWKNTLSIFPSLPEFKWEQIGNSLQAIQEWFVILGKAYFVGLPIVCFSAALLGYVFVQLIWRLFIIRKKSLGKKIH